jgi:hypothetical protein
LYHLFNIESLNHNIIVYSVNKKIIILLFAVLTLFLSANYLRAQVLQDSSSVKLLKQGIDYVYNFQFTNAERISDKIQQDFPDHPINNLLKGMMAYWKNYPILPETNAQELFESNLRKCIETCEKNKDHSPESEMLLVNLCARGLLLLYFTDNDQSFEVFPLASSTYQYIRRSFAYTMEQPDLFFFTGVYNYYREAYPEAHPVYKTLAFLFPKGSKEKGLKDLKAVSENSILLQAEANSFLSEIYMYFENDVLKATSYSRDLHTLYPNNPQYLASYIKTLLIKRSYDEAEKEVRTSKEVNNPFFQSLLTIFKGIIQEKKYRNLKEAETLYSKGIREVSVFRNFGNEYAAYAYFGLSRISGIYGDENGMKTYKKLAQKLAVTKSMGTDY